MSNTLGPQGLSCSLFRASMIKPVQAAVGPPAALCAGLSFSGSSIAVPGRAPAQEHEGQTSDWQLQAVAPSQPPASVPRKSLRAKDYDSALPRTRYPWGDHHPAMPHTLVCPCVGHTPGEALENLCGNAAEQEVETLLRERARTQCFPELDLSQFFGSDW